MSTEEGRAPARLPALGLAVVACVAVALGVGSVVSRATSLERGALARNDFTQDYLSASAWARGLDPYQPKANLTERFLPSDIPKDPIDRLGVRNPHPPVSIVVMRPFAAMEYQDARVLWLIITAVVTALGLGLASTAFGVKPGWAAVIGLGMLAVPVIQKDLLYGQLNGILLLLIVVGWRWLRRGSDIASGLSLGLATALRLYPAFLLLPLLMMRRFRAAAALAMTSAAATLIGSLALGLDDSTRFVRTVAGENFRFWRSAPMNISLVSLPFRWLTRSFWRPDAPDLSRVASLLALVLVVLVVVIALRSRGAFSGDRFLAAIPWMLLATPLSWEFSLVLAMPVVLAGFIRRRGAIRPLPALGSALVLVGIPLGLQGPAPGTPPAVQIFGYALPMYGLLILGLTEVQRDANAISVAVDAARLAAAEQ